MSTSGKPLRIAQLVEALESGGAEALAVDIAGALAERGHESHLIVLRGDGPFRERVSPAVRLHDLGRPRRDGSQFARVAYFLGTCRRLRAVLRAERIDVLQAHLPKANFLGLVMAWWGGGRVFATVHNNREFDYGDGAGRAKQWLRRFGYRQMVRGCRGVIAVSDQVRRSLLAELRVDEARARRVRVVANGVRATAPVPGPERHDRRAGWGVAPGEVLIVGVGRLTRQKDFASLVRALALLPDDAPPWRCLIAGEGELRHDLERAIEAAGLEHRCRLAGLVPDVGGLLAAGDIFCLPSRFEGLPLVLLEAMEAGLPVAAYAIDGVVDVVTEGAQARLAPPGDAQALSSVLLSLLRDGEARQALGAAGRRLVAERYGFDRVVSLLEAAYEA